MEHEQEASVPPVSTAGAWGTSGVLEGHITESVTVQLVSLDALPCRQFNQLAGKVLCWGRADMGSYVTRGVFSNIMDQSRHLQSRNHWKCSYTLSNHI
jgi:hypothetical protein